MKKKKAMALPGAIFLCTMLLIVSVTVAATIMAISTLNIINRTESENELDFLSMHEKFVNGGGVLPDPGSEKYRYRAYNYEYESVENEDIKALVAWKLNDDVVKYYSIVDFSDAENIKVLAYQTSYLYITEDENYQYLGGYLAIPRSCD